MDCGFFVTIVFAVFALSIYALADDELFLLILCLFAIIQVILGIANSELFHAKKYAELLEVTDGNWAEDMPEVETVSNIALMDSISAKAKGETTLSSLSDVVSRYHLGDFTQINYNGTPMKIAPLEYDDFFKYWNFKNEGIPGYVLINPVNGDARYVKLDNPYFYSPSASFSHYLQRKLHTEYPDKILGNSYFEISDASEQDVYWVTSVYKSTIGLWAGKVIDGAIILNAQTGETKYYTVDEIPEWVDVVFDGDYISELYDYYGMLSGGFWNSLTSQTNCTICTDDYGYVTKDNDIWIYTGVTSVVNDSSNIGLLMANERTGETKYYNIGGADEHAAMTAAEGEVANFGYTASFPSVINVHGEPTYIMVLKDVNHIVKKYAMVNLRDYSKIVVADTQDEIFSQYAIKMGFETKTEELEEVPVLEQVEEIITADREYTLTIQEIIYIVDNGKTYAYIKGEDTLTTLKMEFDESLIFLNSGETVTFRVKVNSKHNPDYPMVHVFELDGYICQ